MGGKLDMRAFFDGWTTLGQPLSMAAMLMRICVAVVIGAVIGIDREIRRACARTCWCASARRWFR